MHETRPSSSDDLRPRALVGRGEDRGRRSCDDPPGSLRIRTSNRRGILASAEALGVAKGRHDIGEGAPDLTPRLERDPDGAGSPKAADRQRSARSFA